MSETAGRLTMQGVDSVEYTAARRRAQRLAAVADLAIVSQLQADGHRAANLFRDFYVGTLESGTQELRDQLNQARTILARWTLMQTFAEFRTIDLARIENEGDWEATARAEHEVKSLTDNIAVGAQLIDRIAPEAKRRIMVDPGIVSGRGLVAVRRKRLMLATQPQVVTFRDQRHADRPSAGRDMTAVSRVEIDKVSEFVLDIDALRRVSPYAAREVMAAIAHDAPSELTQPGRDYASPEVLEAAIDEHHPMLTPAVTTYFADRKFTDIRQVSGGVPERDLPVPSATR